MTAFILSALSVMLWIGVAVFAFAVGSTHTKGNMDSTGAGMLVVFALMAVATILQILAITV